MDITVIEGSVPKNSSRICSGFKQSVQRSLVKGFAVWICLTGGLTWAQVLIQPTVVEFAPRQRTVAVTVTLSEKAQSPMRLQAELLRWGQGRQGEAVTEPSSDLLVSPPIAVLQPGQQQVFRVALRAARAAPEEMAYRLILEDVAESPPKDAVNAGMAINFRMRFDLPVLIAPAGKVVNILRWKPCLPPEQNAASPSAKPPVTNTQTQACVQVLNAGNRRVKVNTVTLNIDGSQTALTLKDGDTVLAGAEREWRIPLQAGQTGALRSVQVQTARGETLQAEAGGF